ncbi:MAG: hypothetical protein LBK42_00550, partial [Propionibacteriaceae bacterium]|nr:hypothetical protein [Propionibacteriaceae bacterium]
MPPEEGSYSIEGEVLGTTTGGGGAGGGGGGSACYSPGGREIACQAHGGYWDGYCYSSLWSSDPNDPDPEKQYWWNVHGKTNGVLTICTETADACLTTPHVSWAPDPNPPPTTQELADAARWLLEGTITAPELGVWPGELGTDESLWPGAVGMPAWF